MAIAYRSSTNAYETVVTSPTEVDISKPSGTAEDDVLILVVGYEGDSEAPSCSGFTLIDETLYSDNKGIQYYVDTFYKVAGSSEPSTYAVEFPIFTHDVSMGLTAFSGCDTSDPIGNTSENNSYGTSVDPGAITIQTSGNMALHINSTSNSAITTTPPTGTPTYTEDYDYSPSGCTSITISYATYTSTGTTGSKAATLSSSDNWGAHHIELQVYIPQLRSYSLHYYKDGTYDIPLWDSNIDLTHSVGVYSNSETSYAELTTVGASDASDLMVRKDGVTYAFALAQTSTWDQYFDNGDWEAASIYASGTTWDTDHWESGYVSFFPAEVVELSELGTWNVDYRPIAMRVTYTGGEYVSALLLDVSFNKISLDDHFEVSPGETIVGLDFDAESAGDIKYLIAIDFTETPFNITNIEFSEDYVVPVFDGTSEPPITSAFAEAFIHEDTASATNRSNTSEADVALTGAADLEQGDWSGQWTAPDLTLPENNLYLTGYCDFLQQSGTARSGALCQLEVDGTKAGIFGVSTWGYNRYSGGADESTRHMVSFLSGTLNEVYTVREATQLNSSDRVGDYNRTSGDPRGMWSLNLKGASDYIVASSSTTDNASGVIGNSPRPIDLGTPSSLTSGSWKTVTFSSTDGSSGSTITRSTNTFTVAANSVVLCHFVGQFWGAGPRKSALIRMDIDGSPYAYTSCYMRNASMDGATCSITMPVITGGSSVDVTFSFVDQAETTTELHMDMRYKAVSFIDFTGQDIVLLEQGTTDITGIDGATPDTVSWPVADEIQVDSSFDHPAGNLTRIENNAGEEITVLAGFCFLADRSVATSGTRQFIAGQLVKTGTDVDYCIAGETSRGAQGDDDCFIAGASYCAPVVLGTSDYLELDIKDIAQNTGGSMINCSDEKALYMWAIRIDN